MALLKSFFLYFLFLSSFCLLSKSLSLTGVDSTDGNHDGNVSKRQNGREGVYSTSSRTFGNDELVRSGKWKRNDDDPDLDMTDVDGDGDIEMSDDNLEKFTEAEIQRMLAKAADSGKKVGDKADKAMESPPKNDPQFSSDLLKAGITVRTNVRGIPGTAFQMTKRMIPELPADLFDMNNLRTYQLINRADLDEARQPVAGGQRLQAYISKQNQHLFFSAAEQEFPDRDKLRDWIYQCWVKGSEPKEGSSRVPLKFITFRDYHDQESFDLLRLLQITWHRFNFPSGLEHGILVRKEEVDWKVIAKYQQGHSSMRASTINILQSIPLVSVLVEMLYTFPNAFQRYEVSAIGFEIWPGTEPEVFPEYPIGEQEEEQEGGAGKTETEYTVPEDDPHFNIVIKLSERSEPLTYALGGQGVPLTVEGTYAELSYHPSHVDMERTSYGLKMRPTFTLIQVAFWSLSYSLAISRLERHIVVGKQSAQKAPEGSIVLAPHGRNAAKDFADVIYSAWNQESGYTVLQELTFGQILRAGEDLILHIREQRKPDGADGVALIERIDEDFDKIYNSLRRIREGEALEILLRDHGEKLGVSGISRIEIGLHGNGAQRVQRGKPFLLIGFQLMSQDTKAFGAANSLLNFFSTLGEDAETIEGANTLLSLGSGSGHGDLTTSDEIEIPLGPGGGNPSLESARSELELCIAAVQLGSRVRAYSELAVHGDRDPSQFQLQAPRTININEISSKYELKIAHGSGKGKASNIDQVTDQLRYLRSIEESELEKFNAKESKTKAERSLGPVKLFMGTVAERVQPRVLNEWARYREVEIKRTPVVRSSGVLRLGLNRDLAHIAVLSIENWSEARDLSDALYVAWRHASTLPADKSVQMDDIFHVSFLAVKPSTQRIIQYIFTRNKLERTEPLILYRAVFGKAHKVESAVLTYYSSEEERLSWVLLLGTMEIGAIEIFAAKYTWSRQVRVANTIGTIVVRWVSKNGAQDLTPEIFVSLQPPNSIQVRRDGMRISTIPLLRNALVIGDTVTTIKEYLTILDRKRSDLVSGSESVHNEDYKEWDVSQVSDSLSCPIWVTELVESGSLSILAIQGDRKSTFEGMKIANYARFLASNEIENLKCFATISIAGSKTTYRYGLRHIVLEDSVVSGPADYRRIGAVLSKVWNAVIAGSIHRQVLGLVSFQQLTDETKVLISSLWDELHDSVRKDKGGKSHASSSSADTPSQVKLRVTVSYMDKVSSKFWKWSARKHRQAYVALMSTPEVSGVLQFLLSHGHPQIVRDRKVSTIYVESTEDRQDFKMVLHVL
ncbi:hypothetical protein TWF281_010437 [Arthrobotrys megalospora]